MNNLAAVARGDIPASITLKNAKILNVFSSSYEPADIAVYSGKIAGIANNYNSPTSIDLNGRIILPSFIDGHIHIEDTMLTPPNFANLATLHGTGSVFADPHEISNALGLAGLQYMFRASQGLPIDIFFGAPSCVPASNLETPFQELDALSVRDMFSRGLVQHLGEMMNYPAIVAGDPEAWSKILAAGDVPLTGHAPGLSGKPLNAYCCAGLTSDHECTSVDEAVEKLSRGMWLMLREGASFHDLVNLLTIIKANPAASNRCMAVSDDITARYLTESGHMDEKLRIMLREGIDEFTAVRLITLNPAEYFRKYDRGAIAPGRLADFVILDNSELTPDFIISEVWKNGRRIMSGGEIYNPYELSEASHIAPVTSRKVRNIPSVEALRVKAEGEIMRVIGVIEGTALTKTLEFKPIVRNGEVLPDNGRDIAKIVCLERHNDTGRFGVGFVNGMKINRGAIGSSVAHDAHNFVVIGMDDQSIITALHALADMGGGLVCTNGQDVTASFALPIGGLMSYKNADEVCAELTKMENAALSLGVSIPHPFMVMSFLCLSVIPELRITDLGCVDITKGGVQDIFVR